jgi:glycogen operon protein
MGAANWSDPNARSLAVHLDGDDVPDRAEDGSPLVDDDFLMFVNGWWGPLDFVVPPTLADGTWVVELESAADPDPDGAAPGRAVPVRTVTVGPQSVTVLRNSHPTTDQHGGAT